MRGSLGSDGKENSAPRAAGQAGLWIFGFVCWLLPALVILYQSLTPSDGARVSKRLDAWSRQGVRIHTYAGESGGLQDGDLVSAVNGVALEDWARDLFRLGGAHSLTPAGLPAVYQVLRDGRNVEVPVQPQPQPLLAIAVENWGVILYTLIFQAVAIFIFRRRPADPAARALFLWGMTSSHFYVWSFYQQLPDLTNPLGFWLYILPAAFLWLSNWGAGLHLALTFPRPLPAVQKRPALITLAYLSAFLLYGFYLAATYSPSASLFEWINDWQRGQALVPVVLFSLSSLVILHQYRRDQDQASRKKIRLVVFSALVAGSLAVFLYLLPNSLGVQGLDSNLVGIVLLLFPLSIAVAILRYQLFDIDLIIRRTLVYSTLTLILGFFYFASVVLLQRVFGALSGGAGESQAAVVISTLGIAALFSPLRQRLQAGIDRRFYRRHYQAEQSLQIFASAVRSETELSRLTDHLLAIIQETIQPESVSLWIIRQRRQTPER